MSCFLVNDEHIHGLLTFAILHNVEFVAGSPAQSVQISEVNATKIGRVLLRANANAVAIRYCEPADSSVNRYRFEPWRGPKLKPEEIRGGCACVDYQCSDDPQWPESTARTILDAIGRAASARCRPLARGERDEAWELHPTTTAASRARALRLARDVSDLPAIAPTGGPDTAAEGIAA